MPGSVVQTFTDPDEYVESIRCARADITVTGNGAFTAQHSVVDLPDLLLNQYADSVSRILNTTSSLARVVIAFPTQPDTQLRWNCLQMQPDSIMRLGNHADSFQHTSGPASFGTLSLSRDKMASMAGEFLGMDLGRPRDTLNVRPPAGAMAKLLRLQAAAVDLAETRPDMIANPAAARGLEEALVQSMLACLAEGETDEDAAARRRHAEIMRRFHAAVAARAGEAIYMTEICAAIGVPQRTLHLCCHEAFGMGPKRYLLLRRMHMARGKLRKESRRPGVVAEIACGLGFWNFGRFAVEYRSLFGETPSGTLRGAR